MFLAKRPTLSVACKITQNFANNLAFPPKTPPGHHYYIIVSCLQIAHKLWAILKM